jgi:hypothetical protein
VVSFINADELIDNSCPLLCKCKEVVKSRKVVLELLGLTFPHSSDSSAIEIEAALKFSC